MAWEDEFGTMLQEYKKHKNGEALLSSADSLFQRFKIELRKPLGRKKLEAQDLEIVGYTFLSKPGTFPILPGYSDRIKQVPHSH